jgi:hypothetical protein
MLFTSEVDTGKQIILKSLVFYVLRLSPPWVRGNIGSTDATKTCHNLNADIFEINNHEVINNTSLDRLQNPIYNKASFNPPSLNPSIQ